MQQRQPRFRHEQPARGGTHRRLAGDAGFAVQLQEIPGHPGKTQRDRRPRARSRRPGAGRPYGHGALTIQGRWDSDPFTLTERDGNYYGLGISDMKGFIGMAIEAAANAQGGRTRSSRSSSSPPPMKRAACAAAGRSPDADLPKARYAVIGEPTLLKPVHMHKGILMEAVKVIGRSGHSSDPSLGKNALEGMHKAIAGLLAYRGEMQHRHHDHHFKVPTPTLNLGHIKGGDNPNRICPECELHFDIRILPGMTVEGARAKPASG